MILRALLVLREACHRDLLGFEALLGSAAHRTLPVPRQFLW